MMSNKYCPHCGEQNVMMFADKLGSLFMKENRPSIPRGDALYAAVKFGPGPDLITFLCDNCQKWFAIFCIHSKSNDEDNGNDVLSKL